MKLFKTISLTLIALFSVLLIAIYIYNKTIGPVGWAEQNTIRAVEQKMKDPGSMVIKSSFVIQKTNEHGDLEIFVCGIVDGINSFGGYTGGSRFASRSVSSKTLKTFDTYTVELEDEAMKAKARSVNRLSPFESVYWNSYCVDDGHPMLTVSD